MNEEIKLENEPSENTTVESMKECQHFCEELVYECETKLKKLVKINMEFLKKDFAVSLHKVYQQIEKIGNPNTY